MPRFAPLGVGVATAAGLLLALAGPRPLSAAVAKKQDAGASPSLLCETCTPVCSGTPPRCTMPDQCGGHQTCDTDTGTWTGGCTYDSSGSRPCQDCGTTGRQSCGSSGPTGPCVVQPQGCSAGCGTGTQSCVNHAWTACSGCVGQVRYCNPCQPTVAADWCTDDCRPQNPTCALPEVCNGCDDDRDGYVDNASGVAASNTLAKGCTGTDTICSGTSTCVSGAWQACANFKGSTTCTNACGGASSRVCDATSGLLGACIQPPELCDGIDNNCNGQIDENDVCRQPNQQCN